MALISRYMLQVPDRDFVSNAPDIFRVWAARKLGKGDFMLPTDGAIHSFEGGKEVRVREAESADLGGFRASLFEQRSGEQINTTFTALSDSTEQWAWIDLERWSDDPFSQGWVPYTPGIVTSILERAECFRGPTPIGVDYREVNRKDGAGAARSVLDPARVVPIVVLTPTKEELAGDMGPARERAAGLQSRLRGIAPVLLLGKGAVEAFSKAIKRAGPRMDVYGGGVRTYLPGTGGQGDWPRRHRLIPYQRLRGRPADVAAQLVTLPLMRAACQTVPPSMWAGGVRDLVGASGRQRTDEELTELVEVAEAERAEAEKRLEEAEVARNQAERYLEAVRESETELFDEFETVRRRLDYARRQLAQRGEAPEEPPKPAEPPDFCSEAVEQAKEHCDRLVFGPNVEAAAEALDEHAEPSWARKAWRVFRAMQAYAEAKASGESGTGGFYGFCERSGHSQVIPSSWIASNESETTDQNQEFRRQRTFSVPAEVDQSGSVYMPAHVKIEQGGQPAPRIHFHDDTDGATYKVHVGWFGPHLDNKLKN